MANASARIEVVGLKDALKTLNKVDKSLRRKITTDYKQIVAGVISDANRLVPTQAPLSGMSRNWSTRSGFQLLPWIPGYKQKIAAKINTRAIREYGGNKTNVGTFGIQWKGATGTMFDTSMAGPLGRALTARYGSRSRVMWKAYEQNQNDVMSEMERLVKRVMDEANRKTP